MSFERRKIRVGKVISDKMDKTVVVLVEWRQPHLVYGKPIRQRTRFMAEDSKGECRMGDTVRIIETRPLSKTKRWRVAEILAREEIVEIHPEEIDNPAADIVIETSATPVEAVTEATGQTVGPDVAVEAASGEQ